MAASGKLSEINVTPLVDVLLVLLIIFMVTTATAEQKRAEAMKQDSIQDKTDSLVALNLPVTPENAYLADPETTKLVIVIDKQLRVFVVRGLSAAAGQDPIADCSNKGPGQWDACFDIISRTLANNQRMLRDGLYLEADSDAPYGFVSGILQALRAHGLQTVDIVTDPHYQARLAQAPTP